MIHQQAFTVAFANACALKNGAFIVKKRKILLRFLPASFFATNFLLGLFLYQLAFSQDFKNVVF